MIPNPLQTVFAIAAALSVQGAAPAEPPKAPRSEPEVLGPSTVSQPDRYEYCSTLSRDNRTLYIGIEHGNWQSLEAYDWSETGWTNRRHVLGSPDFNAHDPYLSADEKRLYFITQARGNADIAYLPKRADGSWGDPEFLGPEINSPANDYYTSFTDNGDLYFSSNRSDGDAVDDYNIYVADAAGNAVRLPSPVNTSAYEGDPYVARDGSYLIFASNRRNGMGRGDLYLSISDGVGGWSMPIPFDERVNTKGHELCPMVSLDGSAFMFTSNKDIRWVSTAIIDEMIAEYNQERGGN
ncbi:MAG: hypothetical protein AAGL10_16390 [Pseudomonadota bacterium]